MSTASPCTLSRLSLSPAIFRYLSLSPAIFRYLPGRCFHGNRGCALGSSFKVESVHMRRQESARDGAPLLVRETEPPYWFGTISLIVSASWANLVGEQTPTG